MKKIFLSIILLNLSLMAFSEVVPIETARKVAKNFYYERINYNKPVALDAIKITQEYTEIDSNIPVIYIFNIGLNDGYIIISGENNTIPVLSYSFENNYFKENVPPAMNWIINSYAKEIINTRKNNVIATEEINSLWEKYSMDNFSIDKSSPAQVPPILGSITWDQDCYYNAMTPANSDATFCNHNPTGCVATAMAMIMKYNAWPATGNGSHSYTHSTSYGFSNNYGTLSANFGTSSYNWASMPYKATAANSELAKIMYHCGVAVEMDYDANGSGALVGVPSGYSNPTAQKAFVNYFKYPSAVYFKKSSFTDANWKAKIKTDIDAFHPILYGGDDGSAGHAFVLDGYQGTNNDYYHFNFGWSGYGNGYFYLTAISPNLGGVGGGSYDFTQNQEGIFSIIKSTTDIEETINDNNIRVFPNPSNGIFNIHIDNNKSLISCEIYNLVGEKVWSNSTLQNIINISSLQKGIYYLKLNFSDKTVSKKIIITD